MTHASRQPQPPGFPVAARPGRDTPRLPASGCATARPAAGTAVRAAAAMTASTAIRKRLTVPGRPSRPGPRRPPVHHCGAARASPVRRHRCLAGQRVVTNSMLHSDSRLPGGTITITWTGQPGSARSRSATAGGARYRRDGHQRRAGRGRPRACRWSVTWRARWAYRREPDGLLTWFEVQPAAAV